MTRKNYGGFKLFRQVFVYKLYLTFGFFVIFGGLLVLINVSVLAKDKCAELDGLDDRLECYEEKVEEKEEEKESIEDKLSEIRDKKDKISQEIGNLSSQLSVTQSEVDSLQADINSVNDDLDLIEAQLAQKRVSLADKINLRNKAIREYYKFGILNVLEMFGGGFKFATLHYVFDKTVAFDSLQIIGVLNDTIVQFEKDRNEAESLKGELEDAQASLLAVVNSLAYQKASAEGEKAVLSEKEDAAEEEIASLEEEIAKLSEKQQSILRQKAGEGIVSGYEPPEYKLPDPPFEPAFAAMSYGAYTHYNGMSQYGAKGRAEDGKDYKDILEYYYKTGVEKKDDFPDKISVQGYGELDFQYYLYGIAEMPSDWPMDALKAQAIAARSYAYRTSKPICTTQSCQVFLKSKADDPPDRWKEAVDETKDKILKDPDTSQYSSTTGGYINGVGWDIDGGSWPGDAYEKKAKSPWFYKAWYTQSYRDDSSKCGRSTPWLEEDEMVDILNAWVVWKKGSSSEKEHISPVTTSCWGGDPYSHSEMAEKADKYGDKYDSISSVDVDISNNGYTSKVYFSTDEGSVSIDGSEFKTVFNLRAPAYVAIRSRLFDIEHEK